MAYIYNVNLASIDANGAFHLFNLKETMKTAGWTTVASGDGLTAFSAVGDVITSAGTGANGFDNTNAWWCGQQSVGGAAPYAGTRQIVLQIGAGAGVGLRYDVRIIYSMGGTANTAGSSPSIAPTFTDENILFGGGTPAAPTYAVLFQAANVVATTEVIAGGVTENFSFYLVVVPTAVNTARGVIYFDGLTNYVPGDLDPFAPCVTANALSSAFMEQPAVSGAWSVFNGTTAAQRIQMRGNPASSAFIGGGIDYQRENPINGYLDLVQIYYNRPNTLAAPGGWKGVSTLWKWQTQNKSTKTTLSVSAPGAMDRIIYDVLVGFWNGTLPT